MRQNVSQLPCQLFLESMRSFPLDERVLKNTDVVTCPLSELSLWENSAKSVGLIKGPRTKITQRRLDEIGRLGKGAVISYIGRHPERILEVPYQHLDILDPTALGLTSSSGLIPFVGMQSSPLSDAVACFVTGIIEGHFGGNPELLKDLTFAGGNDFINSPGHSFTEKYFQESSFANINVGVVGAGDIGSSLINLLTALGANVFYTRLTEGLLAHTGAYRAGSNKELISILKKAPGPSVLTLHLPQGAFFPLEEVSDLDLFIQTSSPSNIDEKALISAVNEGRIRHAAVDVFKQERGDFRHSPFASLVNDERFTLTPHIAYQEPTRKRQWSQDVIRNLQYLSTRFL